MPHMTFNEQDALAAGERTGAYIASMPELCEHDKAHAVCVAAAGVRAMRDVLNKLDRAGLVNDFDAVAGAAIAMIAKGYLELQAAGK